MLKKLLCAIVLLYATSAWAQAWPEFGPLAKEAKEYERELQAKAGQSSTEKAAVLLKAARLMKEAERCGSAQDLVEQALRSGGPRGFQAWRLLSLSAACKRNWEAASRAAYNALLAAETQKARIRSLSLLGETLERRSSWRHDWDQEALRAYRGVLEMEPIEWVGKRLRKLEQEARKSQRLAVDSDEVRFGPAGASICLRFNRSMPETDSLRYGDYIRFEPAFDAVFSREGNTVCASGAAFRTDYRVRVLPGLKAEKRLLAEEAALDVRVGDRDPSLWFGSSAYILPKSQQPTVPLQAVNIDQVSLRLLRIHPGNFLDDLVQERFRKDLYESDFDRIAEREGEQVWQGRQSLESDPNRQQTHGIRLRPELVAEPGLYVLRAEHRQGEGEAHGGHATQWLVVSDIGLTTYQGNDGLSVVARSLSSGAVIENLELLLYARNNAVLVRTRTDEQGVAKVAPGLLRGGGGRAAVSLVGQHPGYGFTFLPLTQPGFDLSDRGVGGRQAPGALDAYVYTDRGVYRPGETVHAVGLLRNRRGGAAPGLPLTLVLEDSSGDAVEERIVQPGKAADYVLDLAVSPTARTGRWTLALYAERDAKPVGEVNFLVEDIVPPRMEASLKSIVPSLLPGETVAAVLQADYLFGAPAADLRVRGELFIEADPQPFPEYKQYRFGRVDVKAQTDSLPLEEAKTNEQGRAQLDVSVAEPAVRGVHHRARVRAEVLDVDGRVVTAQTTLSIRQRALAIGILSRFAETGVETGAEAGFQLIALDQEASPRAGEHLQWRLIHEQRDYQWYRRDGEWHYEPVVREQERNSGELTTDETGLAALNLPDLDGRYRLEITGSSSGAGLGSSVRFHVGERLTAGSGDRPDGLSMSSDKARYQAGETAMLSLRAPFAGHGTLVLASDRVHRIQHFELPPEGARLSVPMDAEWGAGVYALVSAFRPGNDAGTQGAGRAVGVAWLGLDPLGQRLELALDLPEISRPRRALQVPVQVKGAVPGEAVFLSLAAVDEGVLNLTGFMSPDPLAHFHGKRRLGVALRDAYGRLIRMPQHRAPQRHGAGASGRRGMPEKNIQVTALFSGRVRVGADGKAQVPLELPDFAGRLRLMAVAWSRSKSGAAEGRVTVQDPLTLQASLPRFLALGDTGTLTLSLTNLSAPEGEYGIRLNVQEPLASEAGGETYLIDLLRDQRQTLRLPIQAQGLGRGDMRVDIAGPDGFAAARRLKVGIRGRYLPETRRRFLRLTPGQALTAPPGLLDDLDTQTLQLSLSAGSRFNMDVPGLLRQLRLYPYGCLEQVSSRALPLLFHGQLAREWALPEESGLPSRIQDAVQRLLDNQRGDGSFGLWSEQDREEPWLTAYAMEFLIRARAAGTQVPERAYNRALDWLSRQVRDGVTADDANGLADQAYAHYVLALAGQGRPEDARYLLDNRGGDLPSSMAIAQMGATFALLGDFPRARTAFRQALESRQRPKHLDDYGSPLRDLAAALSLVNEYGADLVDPAQALHRLSELYGQKRWLSTQEQAWLALAARGLGGDGSGELRLQTADTDAWITDDPALIRKEGPGALQDAYFSNLGESPVWVAMTADGTPLRDSAQPNRGMSVQRVFHNMDGTPADLSQLRQGDMLVALIQGKASSGLEHRALVVDALPAGLEIDNPRLADARTLDDLDWLPQLSRARHLEALDDRFVAALDLNSDSAGFRLAYLVRVVTPGRYGVPPVTLEDMYKPEYRARGASGELTIQTAD